eukprot:14287920-Alexandrium_andersonii.AAC.1
MATIVGASVQLLSSSLNVIAVADVTMEDRLKWETMWAGVLKGAGGLNSKKATILAKPAALKEKRQKETFSQTLDP